MKLDPKLVFYLKHQRQIEEWAAIRKRVTQAADGFFKSLEPGIRELAARLGNDVELHAAIEEGAWPRYQLYRRYWLEEGRSEPSVSVCFEWSRRSGTFTNAYMGIKADPKVVREAIRAVFWRADLDLEFERSNQWWVSYHYEPPARETFWEDLDLLRDEFLEIIEARWKLLAPFVDQGLEDYREAIP